jgi:Do/DeqQ family serine protease
MQPSSFSGPDGAPGKLRIYAAGVVAACLLMICTLISPAQAQQRQAPETRAQIQLSFAPIVAKSAPAVTNIFAKRVVRNELRQPFFSDPMMQRFFGDRFGGQLMPRERVQNTLGSGVLVRANGVIVTNNHVIEDTTGIRVVLSDRREFDARVLLTDPHTDLAVLKIDTGGEALPVLEFADSDSAQVGDIVLAIGNPFGVGQTVTSGIVSATARTQGGVSDYQFFIQTDAAINPGNSGGALVGADGRLIGINTAIFSRSGGSIGIGFAIPSNMVARVVEAALAGGAVVRPWLGASGQAVTQDLSQGLGLARPTGVLISNIYPGGPADQAGLRVGDVILKVDEREIHDPESLRYRIAMAKLGAKANIAIWRDGRQAVLPMTLKPAPETPPRNVTELRGNHPLTGATIANLSPAYAEELELSPGLTGVIIVELPRNSPAVQIGLQPGDILMAISEDKIKLVDDVVRLTGMPRDVWEIRIRRGDKVLSVRIGA